MRTSFTRHTVADALPDQDVISICVTFSEPKIFTCRMAWKGF